MRLTLGIAVAKVFVHGFLSESEKGKWIVFLKRFWYSVILCWETYDSFTTT